MSSEPRTDETVYDRDADGSDDVKHEDRCHQRGHAWGRVAEEAAGNGRQTSKSFAVGAQRAGQQVENAAPGAATVREPQADQHPGENKIGCTDR